MFHAAVLSADPKQSEPSLDGPWIIGIRGSTARDKGLSCEYGVSHTSILLGTQKLFFPINKTEPVDTRNGLKRDKMKENILF